MDTTSAVLGKVEKQRMINDLPLVTRDTLQLGLLQAGVFAPDPDDGSGNPFSVSGQRSESLTFLLDGGNNTDFLGNNIVVSPNPDAVEEFKILTNNYDAQYGRTSGGIVNQITKSGTNEFHGDVFEFLRNDLFNARDYFLPVGQAKQSFKRNQFGGTGGGPIKKDKLFFFCLSRHPQPRGPNVSAVDSANPSPAHRRFQRSLCYLQRLGRLHGPKWHAVNRSHYRQHLSEQPGSSESGDGELHSKVSSHAQHWYQWVHLFSHSRDQRRPGRGAYRLQLQQPGRHFFRLSDRRHTTNLSLSDYQWRVYWR